MWAKKNTNAQGAFHKVVPYAKQHLWNKVKNQTMPFRGWNCCNDAKQSSLDVEFALPHDTFEELLHSCSCMKLTSFFPARAVEARLCVIEIADRQSIHPRIYPIFMNKLGAEFAVVCLLIGSMKTGFFEDMHMPPTTPRHRKRQDGHGVYCISIHYPDGCLGIVDSDGARGRFVALQIMVTARCCFIISWCTLYSRAIWEGYGLLVFCG